MLQDELFEKFLKPSRKNKQTSKLMERFDASIRKVSASIKLVRVVYLYKFKARDNSA
jgi:hypothetical protein